MLKVLAACGALFVPLSLSAWDYEGHRLVNELALASLPTNFPAFVRTDEARERIAFLSGEPDRWRNTPDVTLRHANGPDHFFDIDYLPLFNLDPAKLSQFRYEFTVQLAAARAAHPEVAVESGKDQDKTRALIGFLPWALAEYFSKLKSAFSYLKTFEEGGTSSEIANAQQNAIYIMGVMGHFAGDAAQPLHTTRNYNGWVTENPKGYTTNKNFHAFIDGGFFQRTGLPTNELRSALRPAQTIEGGKIFEQIIAFLAQQERAVEPLYQLYLDKKFLGEGPEGRKFLGEQMLKGSQVLGDLWLTAWQTAPVDTYLKSALARRKLKESN